MTDLANKKKEGALIDTVHAAFQTSYGADDFNWRWQSYKTWDFVKQIETWTLSGGAIRHKDSRFRSFFNSQEWVVLKEETPPILMSRAVYAGFKAANPEHSGFKEGWFKEVKVDVPGFTDKVYGCDAIFPAFRE